MRYLEYAKQRYNAALKEVDRLKQSEFPYPHIRDALLEVDRILLKQRRSLNLIRPTSKPDIAKNACTQSLRELFIYTPYLGFILRSTNVRNAFEVYAPILRLGRQLIGPDARVLLSSEWDYSPFVLLPPNDLSDFIFIGVPAFESSNPLLVPLAGHELGHNVWAQHGLESHFHSDLRDAVLSAIKGRYWTDFQAYQPTATHSNLTSDLFIQGAWSPALSLALRQLEEVFCDMIGLRLFAESYLHAFAYMLAPSISTVRSLEYPKLQDRVTFLIKGAGVLGVAVPTDYAENFSDETNPSDDVRKLMASIADVAVSAHVDAATSKADEITSTAGAPIRNQTKIDGIVNSFEMVMPADGCCSLTDILNAGWACANNDGLWDKVANIKKGEKRRVLYDLILKSLEVSEYSTRISAP